jgi:hypothetical protein
LPAEELLFTKGDLVSLDFEETYVDLLDFHELTSQVGRLPWKIPPGEPLPTEIYQKLLYAYQLWRSPNILAGAKFTSSQGIDIWFSNLVSYNESLYHRILERLADHEPLPGIWRQP